MAAEIDAAAWRAERERELALYGAWHAAAWQRAKTMPSLKSVLTPHKTRQLTPDEADRRAAEHAELIRRMGGEHGR